MILSELQAKTKRCPFIALADGRGNCVASGCMLWRYHGRENQLGQCGAGGTIEYHYPKDQNERHLDGVRSLNHGALT